MLIIIDSMSVQGGGEILRSVYTADKQVYTFFGLKFSRTLCDTHDTIQQRMLDSFRTSWILLCHALETAHDGCGFVLRLDIEYTK
jgi:hypothetical protein